MTVVTNQRRRHRGRGDRIAPRFDRLEARLALTATGSIPANLLGGLTPLVPQVVAVNPTPGSMLTSPPVSMTVTFSLPAGGMLDAGDFRLDSIAADGSSSPIAGLTEALGSTATQVVLTTGAPLAAGHYRLEFLPGSPLADTGAGSAPVGTMKVIDDFTVAATRPSLPSAVDLGSPVAKVATASGSLDLAGDPGAVDLYEVELPVGHFWSLGAAAQAGSIGSPLLSTLALFDAKGHLVESSTTGDPASPNDPYLFAGLPAGTYYLGVSGLGNLPGSPGGYDPSTGARGSANPGLASGAFRLRVVANPADASTSVVSSSLVDADPTENVPTGLTLGFSGPLDADAMKGDAADSIRVVDASGRSWTAVAVGYNEANATATFVFAQPLPAGSYIVELAGQGGLVDLAGKPPVGPGLPSGELATFTVAPSTARPAPGDYGPIFASAAERGLSAGLVLGPGRSQTFRFVITVPGYYDIQTTYTGDAPTYSAHVGGATVPLTAGAAGVAVSHGVFLQPGVVTLDVRGGSHGTQVDWSFLLETGGYDVILNNGSGQWSALGLQLVAPVTPGVPGGATLGPAVEPGSAVASATSQGSSPSLATARGESVVGTPSAVGLFVAAGTGLVGHPSTQDAAIAAVGPVAPGGLASLATSVAGIPQGLGSGAARIPRGSNSGALLAVPETVTEDGGAVAAVVAVATGPADDLPPLPEAGDAANDPAEASRQGMLDRVAGFFGGMIPSRWDAARPADIPLDEAALAAVERSLPAGDQEEIETADFSTPLGFGVVVVAAAHSHRRLARWIDRRRSRIVAGRGLAVARGTVSSES